MRTLHMIASFRVASLVRRSAVLGCAATLLVIGVQSAGAAPSPASWLFGGNDIANSRTQSAETKISSANVAQQIGRASCRERVYSGV